MNLLNVDSISDDEKLWSGPFSFVQGADTQLGLIDRYILKKPESNWDKEMALCRESIRRINEMSPKPRFYIICGDMLDAYPYEGCERETREKQYADFMNIFKTLDEDIKLVCVCGNHDIGDVPTPEAAAIYRKQFGSDFFSFSYGGVLFVILNSQYLKCPNAIPEETERQTEFIKQIACTEPKSKHIVVFQHIPFFIHHPDEEDDAYYNIEKEMRICVLDKLNELGVRYIFCGHYHGNAGGFYKEIEQVITSAVGGPLRNDPSGFRKIDVLEDKITHEFIAFFENLDEEKKCDYLPKVCN